MGKRGPKPTDKAVLAARGSWRARLPADQVEALREKPPVTPKSSPPDADPVASRFWGDEAVSRRAAARSGPRDEPLSAWALELFALIPGYDPVTSAGPGEWFCEELARDAVDFFASELQLIEGEHANKPFGLQPWQQAIIACLFGWLREDGTRRYREALVYVPRKNGKTPLAAGIVNLVMFQDHEPGAQLYSAAADLAQATLIYRHTAGMVVRNPRLAGRAKIYRTFKVVEFPEEGAVFKALSSDADTKHGLGAHLVVIDELHAHRDGELVDVLMTSTAARREPLVLYITTADFERPSVCNAKYDYACKIRDRLIPDSSFLPVIFEAPEGADWTDPAVWAAANPNLGVSVRADYLARQCERAKNEPTFENTFKRLHLNMRTQQNVRWLPIEKWQRCAGPVVPDELRGRACYVGLDLSTKLDLTCYSLVFPPTEADVMWRVLPRFFMPEENARQREKRDRVPYLTWAQQGLVKLTPGDVVDYEFIKASLLEDARSFEIREVAYDPWSATQIALQLQGEGVLMVEFRQGYASMSEPTKELERLVIACELAHGGNAILGWMVSHVAVEMDPAGNVKLSKAKSTERIDGLIATVMGIGRAMVRPSSEPAIYFWGTGT